MTDFDYKDDNYYPLNLEGEGSKQKIQFRPVSSHMIHVYRQNMVAMYAGTLLVIYRITLPPVPCMYITTLSRDFSTIYIYLANVQHSTHECLQVQNNAHEISTHNLHFA